MFARSSPESVHALDHISLKKGVATKLLNHVITIAVERGYKTISLETGAQEYFKPARNLYEKHGFSYCAPFSSYKFLTH